MLEAKVSCLPSYFHTEIVLSKAVVSLIDVYYVFDASRECSISVSYVHERLLYLCASSVCVCVCVWLCLCVLLFRVFILVMFCKCVNRTNVTKIIFDQNLFGLSRRFVVFSCILYVFITSPPLVPYICLRET